MKGGGVAVTHQVVRSGRLDAVGFTAARIATGRTRFFVDHSGALVPRWPKGEDAPQAERAALGPAHVLASAGIPILFPPVAIEGRWFMDGGVRSNTPLAPALCLGADALLIVSVRVADEAQQSAPADELSGLGQVIGKVLDSVFLDRVAFDLDRLCRINDVVEAAESVFGTEGLESLRADLVRRGRPSYRRQTIQGDGRIHALEIDQVSYSGVTAPDYLKIGSISGGNDDQLRLTRGILNTGSSVLTIESTALVYGGDINS